MCIKELQIVSHGDLKVLFIVPVDLLQSGENTVEPSA